MLLLNADQQAAAQRFTAFMLSDEKEFVISGAAGVGKTTLLKHLMQLKDEINLAAILGTKVLEEWSLTATTNKAAEVLQTSTGISACTIHSLLGLVVRNDFETGVSKISRKPNSDVVSNRLIVVDECSMVDSQLRKYISECTYNCKIVYVGDHCQLAPVGELISPVFSKNKSAVLNTIVRSQHTPEITVLCKQLRETVETGIFKPIFDQSGVIDYLNPEEAQQVIEKTFVDDLHADARILCYTNNKVLRFNQHIRSQRNLPDHFTAGEWVISNGMAYTVNGKKDLARLRVEQEVEILEVSAETIYPFWVRSKKFQLPVYHVLTPRGEYRVPVSVSDHRDMIKETARIKEWPAHFALREDIADLRPRDACTVYKAQGSTYREVFVDLSDIGTCTNASQAARMLYVACSRPTHRIYLLGGLPARFLGE